MIIIASSTEERLICLHDKLSNSCLSTATTKPPTPKSTTHSAAGSTDFKIDDLYSALLLGVAVIVK